MLLGYEKNVLDVLSGKVGVAQSEDTIGQRTYRTRVVAELGQNGADGGSKAEVIGVLGLSIDVTDMKARASLEVDNTRLVIEEQAAKDSNKIKSQFLANVSLQLCIRDSANRPIDVARNENSNSSTSHHSGYSAPVLTPYRESLVWLSFWQKTRLCL